MEDDNVLPEDDEDEEDEDDEETGGATARFEKSSRLALSEGMTLANCEGEP